MTSNNASPEPKSTSTSLGDDIRAARTASRRNQRRFWAVTLTGAIAIVAILGVSAQYLVNVHKGSQELREQSEEISKELDHLDAAMKSVNAALTKLPEIETAVLEHSAKLQDLDGKNESAELASNCGSTKDFIAKARCLRDEDALWPARIKTLTGKLKKLPPEDVDGKVLLLRRRAWARRYVGEFQEAIEDFNVAESQVDPKRKVRLADIAAKRAWMRMRIGTPEQLEKAEEECALAQKDRRKDHQAYNTMGFVHYLRHTLEQPTGLLAETSWGDAELKRTEESTRGLSNENMALIPLRNGEWQKVLDTLGDKAVAKPTTAWIALFAGIAQLKLGEYEKADRNLALWSQTRRDYHIPWLKQLLQKELHPYIEN